MEGVIAAVRGGDTTDADRRAARDDLRVDEIVPTGVHTLLYRLAVHCVWLRGSGLPFCPRQRSAIMVLHELDQPRRSRNLHNKQFNEFEHFLEFGPEI